MAPFFWSRWLRTLLTPRRPRPYRRPVAPPRVEPLEPRLPPATFTWSGLGGVGNWSNGANWVGGVAPSGSPSTLDDLVFPAGAPTSTVNDLQTANGFTPDFNSITINGSNYSISGNPIILGKVSNSASGVVTVSSLSSGVSISSNIQLAGPSTDRQLFTVQGGSDLTLSGQISGATAQLVKEGPGTLVLSNNNSGFTGLITVDTNGGVLRITNANALGDTSSGTVVQSNGQLQVQNVTGPINENLIINGPGIINDGALLNVGGNNTWAGSVEMDSDATIGSNSGTLTITGVVSDLGAGHNLTKVGPGTIVFATNNTYRGETSINNGPLVIETPLGLGTGTLNSSANDTIVNDNPNIGQFGQLQLLDPTGVGFTVLNEQLTINGFGPDGNGALYNVQGNNDWAGNIISTSPSPNGFAPAIGAAAGTNLTIDGVISGGRITKVAPGRVIFTNDNTYSGGTAVYAGALNIRDSNALGTGGVTLDNPIGVPGVNAGNPSVNAGVPGVNAGAALELQVDSGFDPHGRNLGIDSVTGVANKLVVPNALEIAGTGINNTGALHSISGINTWTGPIALGNLLTSTAAIGVEPDPNPSNSNLYFTNDYSLTVTGTISNSFGQDNLVKDDNGQLILPNANTYTGTTDIQQGWVTIENNGSLGGYNGSSDPLEPATTVESGASLMLKPAAGASLNLIKNLVLSGDGISNPSLFGLISQKGALVSLSGNNTVGGTPNGTANFGVYSYIELNGEAGIGVEPFTPTTASSLTISGVIADFPTGSTPGSLTKLGSQRLILEGEGDYTGSTTVAEGVLRIRNNSALGQATSGTAAHGTESYTNTATTLGLGQDEIQSFAISGSAGTFTLTFNGQTTPAFLYNVDPLTVQNDLNDLSSIGGAGGSVTVNESGNFYTVTFGGAFQGINQSPLTANGIGGTVVTIATLQNGDSTALEMQNNLPVYDSVLNSNGLQVFNENLVLNSYGNTTFSDVPVAVLGADMMWRGNLTLMQNTTINVPTGARLTIGGTIDDASNPSPSGSALTLTGGGTLELDGANTYRGTTFVNNGTLVLGNGGALGGTGVSEVQTLTLSGSPAGTFTLSFGGSTTGSLSASSPTLASDIQNALNALPGVVNASGSFTVTASSATVYAVTFGGNYFGFNQPQLGATGASGTFVTVATVISGGGGTVVSDGSAVQLEGDLTVAGEPLLLQGNGRVVANNVPAQWFSVGPSPINNGPTSGNLAVTGRITGVAVDYTNTNIIYVSTAAGGVWKTINGGQTWTPLFDLQDGANEEQQLVVGGTGTFTLSFDGATTGALSATSPTLATDIQAQLDNLSTIGGVYGSVSVIQAGTGTFDVFFNGELSQTPEALIQATPDAMTGVAVSEVQTGIAGGIPMYIGAITMDPVSPKTLYIGTGETNNSTDSYYGTGIYKSIDGGYDWTLVSDNEIQTVTVTGQTGTFNLSFNGATTTNFPVGATSATVQSALNALSTIGGVGGYVSIPQPATTIYQLVVTGGSGDAFSLTFGGQTTGNLDPTSSTLGSDIQTALMKLSSIVAAGGVLVTPTAGSGAGGTFDITFQTPGTTTALVFNIVTQKTGMLAGVVTTQQRTYSISFGGSLGGLNLPEITSQGSGGLKTSQFITLLGNPFYGKGISKIIVDDNAFNGNNGNPVLYAADGDGGSGANEIQRISLNGFANDQTFTLTFTGPDSTGATVSDTTGPITFLSGNSTAIENANAAAIQAALQALGNIGGIGGIVTVTVTQGGGGRGGRGVFYTVTFSGALSQTNVVQLTSNPGPPPGNPSISIQTVVDGGPARVVNGETSDTVNDTSGAPGIWRFLSKSATYQIAVTGNAGDTFTLTFGGMITATLNAGSATLASDIQTALNKLLTIQELGGATVTGVGGGVFNVTLQNIESATGLVATVVNNASGTLNVTISGVAPGAWFDMTGVISANRYAVTTSQALANTAGANAEANPANETPLPTSNPPPGPPPETAGPDDDYRAYFPQAQVTWSDIALIYTDTTNSNPPGPATHPVLYAALGTAGGSAVGAWLRTDTNNGVYWTESPLATTGMAWYVGNPGGLFASPATPPTGVDARSGGFPLGQFSIPNNSPNASVPAVDLYGNIKISAIAGATLASTIVYAAVTSSTGSLSGIYETTTGGSTWAKVAAQPPNYMLNQGDYANSIVAVNANDVYVGGYGVNFPSTSDTGIVYQLLNNVWSDVTVDVKGNGPHAGVHALTYVPATGQLYAGTDGGLFRLETNGNWTDVNGNMTASQIDSVAGTPNALGTVFATSQSNGLEESTNGQAWTLVDGTNGGGDVYIDPTNPNNIYYVALQIGTDASVRRSTDGGHTWATILPTLSNTAPLVEDPLNPARILVGGSTVPPNLNPFYPPTITHIASLVESFDGGSTWSDLTPPIGVTALAISGFQGAFVADPRFPLVTDIGANTYDPNTIYITNGTNIYVTKDGGKSWEEADSGITGLGNIYKLVVDPTNRDHVFALFNNLFGDQVFESTDAGQSWNNISFNLPLLPAWSLAIDSRDGNVYIGLDEGVWVLPSGSSTWQQFGAGLPNVQVRSLQLNVTTNTLLAGTYGRGVYQVFLDDGSTGAGGLQAVSGNSVWTGPVILEGSVSGNTVTLSANGTQVLKNGLATATLNIIGPISDLNSANPARLLKTGLGNVTLSGTDTYNGVTEVQEGYLIVNNPQALGSTSAGTVVDSGAALGLQSSVAGEPLTLNADGPAPPAGFNSHDTGSLENLSNTNTYSGPITLATDATIGVDSGSSLNITGGIGGAFNLIKELTGTLILSGNNTYGGSGLFAVPTDPGALFQHGTVVVQGALNIDAPNGPGAAGNTTTVLDGAQLQLQGGVDVPNQNMQISGTGINNTGALLNVGGANTWEGPILLSQDAGFLPATTPPTSIGIGVQFTTPADSLTLKGAISANFGATLGITKVGPGVLILDNGSSSYSGTTTVATGALRVQVNRAMGTTANPTVVQTGAALEIDGDPSHTGASLTYTGKPLQLNGPGTPEVQNVNVSGTAGGFTLTFNGQQTSGLAYNSTAAQVQSALNALSSIGGAGGSVGVTQYGTPEVQQISVGGGSGTFTLTFGGQTTAALPYNATAAQVQAALNNLSSVLGAIGPLGTGGAVTVSQTGGTYTVTFAGGIALGQQPLLTAAAVSGTPNVTVSEVTQGTLNFIVTFGGSLAGADLPQMTVPPGNTAPAMVTTLRQGGAGALHNLTGNNAYTGSVTLESNTLIGADPSTQLTVSGTVQDPTPAPVPAASLTKVGLGTIVFPNANSYTGLTFVNQGVLNIRNAASLGAAVNEQQNVNLSGASTGQFTLTFEGATTPLLPATVQAFGGTGNLASLQNALNSLSTIGPNGVTVTKTGSIFTVTFVGTTLANLNLPQMTATGFGMPNPLVTTVNDGSEPTTVASGATLQVQGGINVANERLTLNGPGFNNAGALENVSGNNTWSNTITLGSNAGIGVDSAANTLVVNKPIGDGGGGFALTKVGPGTLDNQAADTYTGLTTVNQGTMLLDDGTGQSLAGNLTVGAGTGAPGSAVARWLFANQQSMGAIDTVLSDGLLDLNGQSQTLATLNVNAGQVTTGGSGSGQLTLGGLNMTGGTVTAGTAGGSVILAGNVNAGSTAAGVPAVINGSGTLSLNGATRIFNVNGPTFTAPALSDLEIDAVISGTGTAGINKKGGGTMRLTAAETYPGTTTVTQGTLYADGTVGPVSLAGGTIGGNGTVGPVTTGTGAVTGGDGPGVPPNTLTIQTTGASPITTLNSGTKFDVNLYGPGDGTDSLVQVSGPNGYSGPVINLNGAVLSGIIDPNIALNAPHTILETTNPAWTIEGKFAEQPGDPGVVFINGQKFTISYLNASGLPADPTASPSTVTQVVLTHKQDTATVTVTSSGSPSVYGQGVTFTATVTPEAGTGSLPATDTVTFAVDSPTGPTKTVTLSSINSTYGIATFNPVALFGPLSVTTGGSPHTITATFNAQGADANFANNDSGSTTQAVNADNVTITPSVTQAATVSGTFTLDPASGGDPAGTNGRITRTDGGSWITSGYAAGHEISITGAFSGQFLVTGTANGSTLLVEGSGAAFTHQTGVSLTVSEIFIPGETVTVNANVGAAFPGAGTPTGTVLFYLDPPAGNTPPGTPTASAPLVGGVASAPISFAGNTTTHRLRFAFVPGDSNFNPVAYTPSDYNVTVVKATPTVQVTGSPSGAVHGQTVTIGVTITGVLTPTGTVVFYDAPSSGSATSANILKTLTLSGSGGTATASFTTSSLTTGTHSIQVVYSGDTSFNGTTTGNPVPTGVVTVAGALSFTIGKDQTQTTMSAAPASVAYGQTLTLSASVAAQAPGAGTPTGSVTFYDGNPSVPASSKQISNPVQLTNGAASYLLPTTNVLALGNHTLYAVYSSDTDFATSTSTVGVPVTVLAGSVVTVTSSTTTSSPATSSVFGQAVSFTAAVSAMSPASGHPTTATDTITFHDGSATGPVLGPSVFINTTTGAASISGINTLSVGPHQIFAVFSGDSIFQPASTYFETFTVNPGGTTTTASAPSSATFGTGVALSATVAVTAPAVGSLNGTVTFFDGAPAAGKTPLGSSGLTGNVATITNVTSLSAGAHTIYAVYNYNSATDTNFATSTGTAPITITADSTTTSLTVPSLATYYYSVPLTLTVSVAANHSAAVPTGSVTFTDNGIAVPIAAVPLVNGVAQVVVNAPAPGGSGFYLKVGSNSLVANYAPSTTPSQNFTGGSGSSPVTVAQDGTTTTLPATLPQVYVGQPLTYTATVTAQNGGTLAPNGTVTFYDTPFGGTATQIGSPVAVASNGTAVFTYTPGLTAFGHGAQANTITATYNPTVNSPATSPATNFTTSSTTASQDVLYNDSVSVNVSPAGSLVYGQPYSLTATITGTGQTGNFQGTVTFYDTVGGVKTAIGGPVAVSASGTATTTLPTAGAALAASVAHSITATFTADPVNSDFVGKTSAATAVTVTQDATTTSVSDNLPLGSYFYAAPLTLTATVAAAAPGAGAPTGTVYFYDIVSGQPNVYLGSATLSGGKAVLNPTPLLGVLNGATSTSHEIYALYTGDGNFTLSAGITNQVVNQATTSITLTGTAGSPPAPVTTTFYGEPVTFTATVSSAGGAPVGTVTFTDFSGINGVLGNVALTSASNGVATFTYDFLNPGSHQIAALFTPGSGNFAPTNTLIPTNHNLGVAVTQATPTITITPSPTSSVYVNEPVSFAATVGPQAGGFGVPTGYVKFYLDQNPSNPASTPFYVVGLDGNGVAVSTGMTFTTATAHTISAVYVPYSTETRFTAGNPFTLPFTPQAQVLGGVQIPPQTVLTTTGAPFAGVAFNLAVFATDAAGNRDYSANNSNYSVTVSVLSGPTSGTWTAMFGPSVPGAAYPSITLSSAGTYTLQVEVSDGNGHNFFQTITLGVKNRQT